MKHLLSGNELSANDLTTILALAKKLKERPQDYFQVLANQHLAILFDKPSLRTRMSFSVAMRELGGHVIESVGDTRKSESPQDHIRVLQGYCKAVMIRTFEDKNLEAMIKVAKIPIINGLTDLYHPCQILADLLTLQENFNTLNGLTICYVGDGNNILHSLLLMAPKLGIKVHYACPESCGPKLTVMNQIKKQCNAGLIKAFTDPKLAVVNANAVYTDVWTSMGFSEQDETLFKGFQVNEDLMALAKQGAIFLHCMPMERGKEVSATLPDQPCSRVFQQSENRLHVQKAMLITLMSKSTLDTPATNQIPDRDYAVTL